MSLQNDPVLELFRFHQKIRSAVITLTQLGLADSFNPQQLQDRDALVDFFNGAFAWHDLDEEASVIRRLRARVVGEPETVAVLDQMTAQHEDIESALEAFLPELHRATSGEDLDGVSIVAPLVLAHLREEERTLFPLARELLTDIDKLEIAAEVLERERRRVANSPSAVELQVSAQ